MWDERVVAALVKIAKDDLQSQRWARDFSDKLRERNITAVMVQQVLEHPDIIVLYRHQGRTVFGFWSFRVKLVAVWTPSSPSRWVTAFWKAKGRRYLLSKEDAELIWTR